MIIKAFFYVHYNDVHFGQSEINRKLGASGFWFLDRNDANHVLVLHLGEDKPKTPISYVCVFKEGERFFVLFFKEVATASVVLTAKVMIG